MLFNIAKKAIQSVVDYTHDCIDVTKRTWMASKESNSFNFYCFNNTIKRVKASDGRYIRVVLNNQTCKLSGLYPDEFSCQLILTPRNEYIIVVTDGFLKAEQKYQDIAIQHELGHLFHGHLKLGVELIQRNLTCEHEADEYALKQGYDMIGLLEYLKNTHYSNYFTRIELNKRIAYLKG